MTTVAGGMDEVLRRLFAEVDAARSRGDGPKTRFRPFRSGKAKRRSRDLPPEKLVLETDLG